MLWSIGRPSAGHVPAGCTVQFSLSCGTYAHPKRLGSRAKAVEDKSKLSHTVSRSDFCALLLIGRGESEGLGWVGQKLDPGSGPIPLPANCEKFRSSIEGRRDQNERTSSI